MGAEVMEALPFPCGSQESCPQDMSSGELPLPHQLQDSGQQGRTGSGRRGVGEPAPLSGVRWYGADTLPFSSSPTETGRADTGIIRAGELALPLYRLQHSWLHLTWTIQWSWP